MIRSERLTRSARDEVCTMQSPMCNHDQATTVWCHSNYGEHGKGMGLKAHDIFGFYGCSGCHDWFDTESRRKGGFYYVAADERRTYFQRAHDRSIVRAIEKGIIKL